MKQKSDTHTRELPFDAPRTPLSPPSRTVWYVVGETSKDHLPFPTLFHSPIAAAEHAEKLFPNDSPARHYARVQYLEVN